MNFNKYFSLIIIIILVIFIIIHTTFLVLIYGLQDQLYFIFRTIK